MCWTGSPVRPHSQTPLHSRQTVTTSFIESQYRQEFCTLSHSSAPPPSLHPSPPPSTPLPLPLPPLPPLCSHHSWPSLQYSPAAATALLPPLLALPPVQPRRSTALRCSSTPLRSTLLTLVTALTPPHPFPYPQDPLVDSGSLLSTIKASPSSHGLKVRIVTSYSPKMTLETSLLSLSF
jgi:hypothetical protein